MTNPTLRLPAAVLCAALLLPLVFTRSTSAAEAFEVDPPRLDQLPGGKEADGILGDFVLRNDRVEAVVSHNAPLRRANMSTFYGDGGVTPGCLYDLTLLGKNNDQLTIFAPAGQQGTVSYVRIQSDGKDGEAVVETVVTAASKKGVSKRHEYRLRDGWDGVLIVTTFRNETKEPQRITPNDRFTNFSRYDTAVDVVWADAVDPADKAGYAFGWVERDGMKPPAGAEVELKPGEEVRYARFLAVGRSPAEALGAVAAFRGGPVATVSGSVKEPGGAPAATAAVNVLVGGKPVPAYPDAQGQFSFRLPAGAYEVEVKDLGRDAVKRPLEVTGGSDARLDVEVSPAAAVALDVRDEAGKSIPCKVQFHGLESTPNPNLGPHNRAHGCADQYHSETGQFRVQLNPGTYKVIVTRGVEYSHLTQTVKVEPGKTAEVKGTLKRLVDTTGWVSTDFHNHSTPSGDNTCGTDDRVINLAAEHIEFAPTTEHNRVYDWRPHIEKLGLAGEVNTVSGIELTGGGAHLNAFPFAPVPRTQDGGAPVWQKDPRLNAIVLRDHQNREPDRWVHVNHPDMVENFVDRDNDGRVDGGYLGLGQLLDGLETDNGSDPEILSPVPYRLYKRGNEDQVAPITEFVWLQLLNRGMRVWGVAVCDAHSVYNNGVGGWRTYVRSSTDQPAEIDWREIARRSKAGQSFLTTGPFLQVSTPDGVGPGGTAQATASIDLHVRVQCTDWLDVDRVQVLVNGRQPPELNFTRKTHADWFNGPDGGVVKFDRTITVPLSQDSHLIVVAIGENSTIATGYGTSSQARFKPCAYHNPIFVDVDGGGFTPNGDTLGYPLPTKKVTVEEVRAMLKK